MTAPPDPTLHAEGVSPVTGSDAALLELRREIARLGAELVSIEAETAELREYGPEGRPEPVAPDRSAVLAEEVATTTVARERAEMARFLAGTRATGDARVDEARREAEGLLDAAREDLAAALAARGAAVEAVLTDRPVPDPPVLDPAVGGASSRDEPDQTDRIAPDVADVGVADGEREAGVSEPAEVGSSEHRSAQSGPPRPTGRRRESGTLRVIVYAVALLLAVLLVTQAIVVLLALLD